MMKKCCALFMAVLTLFLLCACESREEKAYRSAQEGVWAAEEAYRQAQAEYDALQRDIDAYNDAMAALDAYK